MDLNVDYYRLQEIARELGLKSHKVPRTELEAAIREELVKRGQLPPQSEETTSTPPPTPSEDDTKSEDTKTEEQKTEVPEDINTAIIYKGSNEVRRYTLETHGEDFLELAEAFANKNKLKMKLENVIPALRCPSCGAKIYNH